MIREIVKDKHFLQKKCEKVNPKECVHILTDLKDTAEYHIEKCLGLAANQIGYQERVIVVRINNSWMTLMNPQITERSTQKHYSKEGCLSLDTVQIVERHNRITVLHTNQKGKTIKSKFSGLASEIVQHEIDHLNGRLI